MILYSEDFVKSFLGRDFMLQTIGTARVALPGDLKVTRCPNRRLLRVPSESSGPNAAGYSEQRVWVGCSKCPTCEQDKVLARIMKWSRRLKAFCTYEQEVMGSAVITYTRTFPRHPDGDPARKHAPSEKMFQKAQRGWTWKLRYHYNRAGIDIRDACSIITVVERGDEFGRLHAHDIAAFRPDIVHPWMDTEAYPLVALPTYHRDGSRQYLDGLGQLWRDVLNRQGYEPLQNWYRKEIESPNQVANYHTSRYLIKGFSEDLTLPKEQKCRRVRSMDQQKLNPESPVRAWDQLTDWWRDKRFRLEGASYRRWLGFRVQMVRITADNLVDSVKRLSEVYCDAYRRHVKLREDTALNESEEARIRWHGDDNRYVRLRRDEVNPAHFEKGLLRAFDRKLTEIAVNANRLGEEPAINLCFEFRPHIVVQSDVPVRHPVAADYLSVASFFGDCLTESILVQPELDDRFNLCSASHFFPFDNPRELRVRDTDVFRELEAWNLGLVTAFNDIVIRVLGETFPGNPWSFIIQGLPVPVNIIDEGRLERVASGYPEIFPDKTLSGLTEPEYGRRLKPRKTALAAVNSEITESLRACADWHELTDIRMCDAMSEGTWPPYPLKKGQVEVIMRIRQGESGIYNLPTGYGKSVCYQMPNIGAGITLVISPLLSLIRDQVDALKKRGVNATWVGGEHKTYQKWARLKSVGADLPEDEGAWNDEVLNRHTLVYCSPESLGPDATIGKALRDGYIKVSHFVIDESHCVSQWADFRPHYRKLAEYLHDFRYPIRCLSLFSATISPRILSELRGLFGDLPFFGLPMARPNLQLSRRPAVFTDFYAFEWHKVDLPAIVYCGQKESTERVAAFLRKQGVKAVSYHSEAAVRVPPEPKPGLPKSEKVAAWAAREDAQQRNHEKRTRIEEQFRAGEFDVLTATVAYGLGIDADVRTVIHDSYPPTLEHYAQEIGRAGRDGQPAACILLSNPGMVPSEEMSDYYYSETCLWQRIARHHGQDSEPCGHCDACTGVRAFLPEVSHV